MQSFQPSPEKEPLPYQYGQLDPRKGPDDEPNKELLGKNTLGIEVTIPRLSERCGLGNIDPQHTEGLQISAVQYVLQKYESGDFKLPPEGSVLVTIRPDADAIGTMALITLLLEGEKITREIKERIALINKIDSFVSGKWPGKQPLPSKENPWPSSSFASGEERKEFSIVTAISMDNTLPLSERIRLVMEWLKTDKAPKEYQDMVNRERQEMISALENGEIKIEVREVNGIPVALVESTYLGGTTLAYTQAPVIIVKNPKHVFPGIEGTYLKYTVAQYNPGWVDLNKVKEELNKLENGWGGSQTIIGSPQGISSTLEMGQIFEIVAKNIIAQKG